MKHKLLKFAVAVFVYLPALALATDCSKLAPLVCLESVRCTLDCERDPKGPYRCKRYFCRDEIPPCETAVSQVEQRKGDCEKNPLCRFEPGGCFCKCDFTNDCNCSCGGGPPANCVKK